MDCLCILLLFCILSSSLSRKLRICSVLDILVGLSEQCVFYTLSEGFIIMKLLDFCLHGTLLLLNILPEVRIGKIIGLK